MCDSGGKAPLLQINLPLGKEPARAAWAYEADEMKPSRFAWNIYADRYETCTGQTVGGVFIQSDQRRNLRTLPRRLLRGRWRPCCCRCRGCVVQRELGTGRTDGADGRIKLRSKNKGRGRRSCERFQALGGNDCDGKKKKKERAPL